MSGSCKNVSNVVQNGNVAKDASTEVHARRTDVACEVPC